MRARILALTLVLASFAAASRASAAAYDFTVSLVPGTTAWELRVSSLSYSSVPPLAQVTLGVSDSLETFTSAVGPPYVAQCVGCELTYLQPVAPGFNLLTVPLSTPQRPPPFGSLLLGTFGSHVNTASLVEVLPGETFGAPTFLPSWPGGYPDPSAYLLDFSITVVPEPAAGALLILAALAALAGRARA